MLALPARIIFHGKRRGAAVVLGAAAAFLRRGIAASGTLAMAAGTATLPFAGCAAIEVSTAFDDRGAEVTVRADYAAVANALLSAWRGDKGLPDFRLSPPDAETLAVEKVGRAEAHPSFKTIQ